MEEQGPKCGTLKTVPTELLSSYCSPHTASCDSGIVVQQVPQAFCNSAFSGAI